MEIWSGYIGLAIAFVIITAIFLWFFLRTPGNIIIKVIMIPVTIWYGLVLYYTAPNLMGWPTTKPIPENSQILAFRIKEPNPKNNDPGAIYFWLNPKNVFSYNSSTHPRAHQLPYSRKMHKRIIEAQRQARGVPGARVRIKTKGRNQKGDPDNEESKALLEFEIINPVQLLPK
jgi:hypothetical protein